MLSQVSTILERLCHSNTSISSPFVSFRCSQPPGLYRLYSWHGHLPPDVLCDHELRLPLLTCSSMIWNSTDSLQSGLNWVPCKINKNGTKDTTGWSGISTRCNRLIPLWQLKRPFFIFFFLALWQSRRSFQLNYDNHIRIPFKGFYHLRFEANLSSTL